VTQTHATPFETPHMSIADYLGSSVTTAEDGRIGFTRG